MPRYSVVNNVSHSILNSPPIQTPRLYSLFPLHKSNEKGKKDKVVPMFYQVPHHEDVRILTLALDRDEWSGAHLGYFTPR
jgi:hypothetical protein